MADTNHLNILPFGQLNTIVNDIDNTHNDTFFTTTYDSLGEIDPDINQCLNGRSHQCGEYDQVSFSKTFKECKSLSIIHTNIRSTKKTSNHLTYIYTH